jgi:heterotetrameric sarcosine oxidase gamma subunit
VLDPHPTSQPISEQDVILHVGDAELRRITHAAILRVQALRSRGNHAPCADAGRLPFEPNSSIGNDPVILWQAPDDWLAYSTLLSVERIQRHIDGVSATVPLFITDISSASIIISLSGSGAAELLMHDCTLDLEGNAIKPGHCARTTIAQTAVMIHRPLGTNSYRLIVERSLAGYVWDVLCDIARHVQPA